MISKTSSLWRALLLLIALSAFLANVGMLQELLEEGIKIGHSKWLIPISPAGMDEHSDHDLVAHPR